MSTHNINLAGTIAGSIIAILALVTLLWRAVAKPWLVSQLVDPLHETHRQVAVNGHSSERPTVLDLLAALLAAQDQIGEDLAAHRRVIDQAVGRLDERLATIERRQPDPEPDPTRERTYP